MEDLLEMRQQLIYFYKRYEPFILAVSKFAVAFFLVMRLSTLAFGAFSTGKSLMAAFLVGALSIVVSSSVVLVLLAVVSGLFLSYASIELAVCVMLVFFLVFVFYARIFPKESLMIPALLLCYFLKIPFAAVLFAGVYLGIAGMIPIGVGVVLWNLAGLLEKLVEAAPKASFSLLGIPDSLMNMYTILETYLDNNSQMIWQIFIFGAVIVLVYLIAHFGGNYAKELSIAIGGGLLILILLMTDILEYTELGLLTILLGGIVSIGIVEAIRFFEIVLDYSGATRVEFEDKENYYYVKIVPKVLVDGDDGREE